MGNIKIEVGPLFAGLGVVIFVLWWIEWPLRSVFNTLQEISAVALIGGLGVCSAIGFLLALEIHNMITRQGRWK